jgi:hypothetical protein
MANKKSGEFGDVTENETSRQTGELATKLTAAHGAQTKTPQQLEQPKQDSAVDVSREESAKPSRRKSTTKTTKRTKQAAQTPSSTDKSIGEIITPSSQLANDASAPAIGTAGAHLVADVEPVPQGDEFLCTFTLCRPGLVGLNKLAIHLNDLLDTGSIAGWQTKGWEDPATKLRTLIGFGSRADAIVAIKSLTGWMQECPGP